ncbi:MAG: hypothetical protein ACTS85_03215 [Arsenophonus sp. NC-PG7-MAG3]
MELQPIAVGSKVVDLIQTSFQDYLHCFFLKDMALKLIEILMGKCGKSTDLNCIIKKKREKILVAG